MKLSVASDFTDLVFHVFAHIRLRGPGDLFEPAYMAWAQKALSPKLNAILSWDSKLLLQLESHHLTPLQSMADLHRSIMSFRKTTPKKMRGLHTTEVENAALLDALVQLHPASEVLHVTLGLVAAEFEAIHRDLIRPHTVQTLAPVAELLEALAPFVPGLRSFPIELVWPLGPRGRALPHRVLAGAPAPWNNIDPATTAVVALHEYAVHLGSANSYVRTEWAALLTNTMWMGHAPEELQKAHQRWLALLDLQPLLENLEQLRLITAKEAQSLSVEKMQRPTVLATIHERIVSRSTSFATERAGGGRRAGT